MRQGFFQPGVEGFQARQNVVADAVSAIKALLVRGVRPPSLTLLA
jgi:hypothetical protein